MLSFVFAECFTIFLLLKSVTCFQVFMFLHEGGTCIPKYINGVHVIKTAVLALRDN